MSEPTENNQTETDDWAAAMAEQTAATQNDAIQEESGADDWAAAMAEQTTSTQNSSDGAKANTLTATEPGKIAMSCRMRRQHQYSRNFQKMVRYKIHAMTSI